MNFAALEPGAHIEADGRAYVLVQSATIVNGRVSLPSIPLDALGGQAREWVEARGWHKTAFYFAAFNIPADRVSLAVPGRYRR